MAFGKPAGQDERIIERRRKVFDLRKAGLSLRQIADTLTQQGLNVSYVTVRNDLRAVLLQLARETETDATTLRALELARLDQVQMIVWAQVRSGDLRAVETYLRLAKRRAELLGLDAPVKSEVGLTMPPELLTMIQAAGLKPSDVWPVMMQVIAESRRTDAVG